MSAETRQSYIALLQLTPIRRHIRPEDWPAQRRRVLSVVQHVARDMIGASDSFAIHGDEVCVVTFSDATYESATLGAAAIGRRIARSLFGEPGLARVSLQPRVVSLKDLAFRDDLKDLYGTLPPDAPATASRVGPSTLLPGPPAPSADERRQRRRQLVSLFASDQSSALFNTFMPIWNIDSKMASRFLLVPCRTDAQATVLTGYAALGASRTDSRLIGFDMRAIEDGLLALKQALDAGYDGALMLPLHFDTAGSNQGRMELMEIFPNLPPVVRSRISFALFGVPNGVPEGRLHSVAGALMPLVKEVLIVLEPAAGHDPNLRNMMSRIRAAEVQGVAISFAQGRPEDTVDGACAICARAVPIGLKICALGLISGRAAHRLAVAGCTDFGGPLFGGPFDYLPRPYPVHAKVFEQYD